MTLIETLVAITVGLSVALGLYFFMSNLNGKLADSDTANVFIKIAGAMDNRFAVDGYAASNFNKKDWTNNTEVNAFLNGFNGKSSTCSTPDGWVPNVKDPVLKAKQIKSKNIPCNIFKDKAPLDAKMTAKLIINNINNQILTSYVAFYYDTNQDMQDAYPRWKNIINESYNKDTLNNSSKHIYSFIDRSKNTFINDKECITAQRNCALVVGVVSDEASSLIHLSTIGENKQVGKLSFSRGILSPQICQKWTKTGTAWKMEKTICGIENDNEKIGFKLGNINSDLISMDKTCSFKKAAADGYLDVIKDTDGSLKPVSVMSIPCGLNAQTGGGSFVVTAIADTIQSKDLFSEELVVNNFNTDVLSSDTVLVNEKTNVFGQTNVSDTLILTNQLFADNTQSETTDGLSLRATGGYILGNNLLALTSIDTSVVEAVAALEIPRYQTFSVDVGDLNTQKFQSRGTFAIGGNIVADTFTETGVLSANKIDLTTAFYVTGSGAMGGYAEIGGSTNEEKIGISAPNATFRKNFFTRLDPALTDSYMIQIVNASAPKNVNNITYNDMNFGVNSHGGIYLRQGLSIPNEFGGSSYSINANGDLTAVVNYYESSGCCTDAPQQFYGKVGVSGTFTIQSNPRFVDVEDLNGRNSGLWINPAFILDNPKYPNKQDYKINSLVYNNLRLSSYANKIGTFEASYNSFNNAIHTPGLKGPSGVDGAPGLTGDQGIKGNQGVQGGKGLTGPIYNANSLIWLPKEVTCGKQDSDMSTKYGSSNNKGAWTYNDVIEGLCTTGKGSVKYFKRLKPLGNSCSASQFEYDVYECKEAKYRVEPYAFNNKVQGNFCLGDSLSNKQLDEGDPAKGITDKDNNTICFTDTNNKHYLAGRATKGWLSNYTSVGGNDALGTKNKETSIISVIGKNKWDKVSTCGADSSRTPEDYLGLSSADFIEDTGTTNDFSQLADEDLAAACKKDGAMTYRKVDYTGLVYGNPTQFEAYRVNKYKNVANYLKTNSSSCDREQVYEISRCESGIKDLTKLNYTTHPIGFIMPKAEDAPDNGNGGGLTGKYVWLKGDKVCLPGTAQDSYPGSTDWYASDRIDTPCSVENAYRSEFLGVCGANSDRSSYQMYACRDEYYKPAQPDLSYRLVDIKCLNSTGQAVDGNQQPLPIEKIDAYYPNAQLSSATLTAGKACYTEREQMYNQESNSNQCNIGLTKFSIYDCR